MEQPLPIARIRKSDKAEQPLATHLCAVGRLCGHFADAAGLKVSGLLIGMLHDLGKFSERFQQYIRSQNQDDERLEYDDDSVSGKVRINHSAAGAQRLFELWDALPKNRTGGCAPVVFDLLAGAILSHHNLGGLVDFLSADGEQTPYSQRLSRDSSHTFLHEVRERIAITPRTTLRVCRELHAFTQAVIDDAQGNVTEKNLQHILLEKFLYSCLIDADHTDSADFDTPANQRFRKLRSPVDWRSLHARFEQAYRAKYGDEYSGDDPVVKTRRTISQACLDRAATPHGVYRLPVPTGGGKTLASLRFALAHAAHRQDSASPIRRIIYVLPFTAILIQNADEARKFIGAENVLEHHANLLPNQITRRQILLSENWDAPVVFTTTVQFLNAFYSDSKGAQRRMHQAASSVLIFDEAQALPVKTLHLFNHALAFLTRRTASTALVCTATQPLLDNLNPVYGRLVFSPHANLVEGISFNALSNRVRLLDKRTTDGSAWSCAGLCEALRRPLGENKHTLVIVNTKSQARKLFAEAKIHFRDEKVEVVHLSNSLCPAHLRDAIGRFHLDRRRDNGNSATLLCISTSLVEAGVNLDFDLVVRDIAGFVSIVQAAGRCNRHGKRPVSDVWIVNLEMKCGRPGLDEEINATARVLRETMNPSKAMLLTAENVALAVKLYFQYHYHEKQAQMLYPVERPCQTTLLDLLTNNSAAQEAYRRRGARNEADSRFYAAPESAARLFEVIDNNTRGVIVPYLDGGQEIINDICAAFRSQDGTFADIGKLIARARPYTVNLYDNEWVALRDAMYEAQEGIGVYCLDARHYHPEMGVVIEAESQMELRMG